MAGDAAEKVRGSLHPELLSWLLHHMDQTERAEFVTELVTELESTLTTLRGTPPPSEDTVADLVGGIFDFVEDWRLSLLMVHSPGWPEEMREALAQWDVYATSPDQDLDQLWSEDRLRASLGL